MGHADVAARHHQIIDIPGIEAAVGHRILLVTPRLADGTERFLAFHAGLHPGIMQVHAPGRGERGILIFHIVLDILLLQDHVAQEAARLPFAADTGGPVEALARKLLLIRSMILEIGPVAVYGPQPVVPDMFDLFDLVAAQARLPVPFAMDDGDAGAVAEGDGPGA